MILLLAGRLGGRRFYLHETLGIIRTKIIHRFIIVHSQKTKNSPNFLTKLGEFLLSLSSVFFFGAFS